MRKRVIKARQRQLDRFKDLNIYSNNEMKNNHLSKYCALSEDSRVLLRKAVEKFHLSTRAYFKVIKVSRTIADLEESEEIKQEHVAEALQYRRKM